LSRAAYETSTWVQSQRDSFSILSGILQTVAGQIVVAIVLVAVLEFLNPFFVGFLEYYLQSFKGYPILSNVLGRLEPDRQMSLNVVIALAQIAGVFLALYFTTISVVASSVYANVQADVRSLLIREKVGNRYMQLIAFFGGVSLVLLVTETLGYSIGLLNFLLVSLMGLVAIFSIVVLGARAFDFFSPASLTRVLGQDIRKWIYSAAPSGFQWDNPSFQAYYQRRAESSLRTYRNIMDFTIAKDQYGTDSLELALPALGLLQLYSSVKTRIPTNSQWFRRTAEFPDWLTSGYTELDIALRTSTPIQPKAVPDMTWFEEKIEEIVIAIMQTLARLDLQKMSYYVGYDANRTLTVLSSNFLIDESLGLLHMFYRVAKKEIDDIRSPTLFQEDPLKFGQYAGLIDACGLNLISILLAFSAQISLIGPETIHQSLSTVDWKKQGSIYAERCPRPVIERLEFLRSKLNFELKVEGEIITPLWYQEQMVAIEYVRFFSSTCKRIVAEIRSMFEKNAGTLIATKQYFLAAQVVERGLEACSKFLFHRQKWEQWLKGLETKRRVSDIPWPQIDWSNIDNELDQVRRNLIVNIAGLAPQLAILHRPRDLPDYFGHAYNILAEQSYEAMATGDIPLFQRIFPSFFGSCLLARDLVLSQKDELDQRTLAALSTEPIIDLLELSGYAILCSQLDKKNKGFWTVVKRQWEFTLNRPKSKELIRIISSAISYRDSLFAISPRDPIRTRWHQRFEEELRTRGLLEEPFQVGVSKVSKHPSPVIRAAVPNADFSLYLWRDVFIATFLMHRPESRGVQWPRDATSFASSLRRERSRK
jgi:hypothetical protein